MLFIILTSVVKVCSFQDVNDFEIKEDGETVISGKLGSALVGGVLLGVIGAIARASEKSKIKKKCSRTDMFIYINDLTEPVVTMNIFNKRYKVKKLKNDYVIREMIGLLTYAKNQPQNDTKTPFDMKKYNELSETSKKKK